MRRFLFLAAALILVACASSAPPPSRKEISFDQLLGWREDDHASALAAFLKTWPALAKGVLSKTDMNISPALWRSLCDDARASLKDDASAQEFFERRFMPYRVKGEGLFTGYYVPLLQGARRKDARF